MDERIAAARAALGRDCVVLGHHYQRDEVIRFADFRGEIDEINQEKGKIRVLVSFFGRETPVELDFLQAERES